MHAASATNEVDDDALLTEEAGVLLETEITVAEEVFDDADDVEEALTEEVDEALTEEVDALVDVVEVFVVARRTILPIRSAPHR